MLTEKQSKLYLFLKSYWEKNQMCPSFEQMRCALGVQSKSTVSALICRLEEKKFIHRLRSRARAIEILK